MIYLHFYRELPDLILLVVGQRILRVKRGVRWIRFGVKCMNIFLAQSTGNGHGSGETSDCDKMYNESTKLHNNVSIKTIIKYCLTNIVSNSITMSIKFINDYEQGNNMYFEICLCRVVAAIFLLRSTATHHIHCFFRWLPINFYTLWVWYWVVSVSSLK